MLAAVYLRISDDRAGQGLGVARQERDCRNLCKQHGWNVGQVFTDNDQSAYRGKRRPAYEAMLEQVKAGVFGAIVAWHPDRLHRAPKELESFIDLLDATGTKVATVQGGAYDLSTASGRMTARVVGAVARHESEHKAERQRSKHDELFRAGRPSGGDRCFGYADDLVTVVPEQAEMIQWAARHLLDGGSLRAVCSRWNTLGVRTGMGNEWAPWVVKRLLTSARIAGKRERDGVVVDAVWEWIVPWETVQRLRVILNDPRRRRNRRSTRYLLTGGIARCGPCGAALVARPRENGLRCYVCASGPGFKGCGKIRVLAEPFEADVLRRVRAYLLAAGIQPPAPDPSPLVAELDRLEAQQAELAVDFYTDRSISRGQFTAASNALMDRLTAVKRDLATVETIRIRDDPQTVADRLLHVDIEAQRAIVRDWVAEVTVGPAVRGRNFYDDARVAVVPL